ncbi:CarD family transcriptional regulator [Diplocloster modestus]|uniref:CarD-like/TRCF RNAP-interacting domain-containing protein n=1 Tax=Diplocloster modestus TaxID=2850322 RepID=A0ABS6K963_9FIRM|nr:CarD family transcriptional regulator [Diplocloster modestus]MBU9727058.1 hypothetical protein [Diplocloster modestus]
MFQINDVIVYENGGVCTIKDIGVPEFLHTDIQYYTMQPVCDMGRTIYVKTKDNKAYMRTIVSRDEAEEYLTELPAMVGVYNEDDKIRDKEFGSILKSCECSRCFRMYKGISIAQNRKILNGKKLNMNDDRYLHKVEELLSAEYSVIFHISLDQAKEKISSALE